MIYLFLLIILPLVAYLLFLHRRRKSDAAWSVWRREYLTRVGRDFDRVKLERLEKVKRELCQLRAIDAANAAGLADLKMRLARLESSLSDFRKWGPR